MVGKEEANERLFRLFLKIDLDEKTAKNTVANRKYAANLEAVIKKAGVLDECSRSVGNFLYQVAGPKYPSNALRHLPKLVPYIVNQKIKNNPQLETAFKFLGEVGTEELNLNE